MMSPSNFLNGHFLNIPYQHQNVSISSNIAFIMDTLIEDSSTSPEGVIDYHHNSVLKGLAQLSTILKGN